MARYLNPIFANANIAINTATAVPVNLTAGNATDVELVSTVDAVVVVGIVRDNKPVPVTAANISASANGSVGVGPHFLPAYVPRGFGVAAGAQLSFKACTANGSVYISEMG